MDFLMQLDKENGSHFYHSSKHSQGSFIQSSLGLHIKKSKGLNTEKVQPLRKALGNVNVHIQDRRSSTKVKQVYLKSKKTYPEIENFIPYNPLDFETFDVHEEHLLSDRCLAGVSLFVSLVDAKHFEALTSADPSPMENDDINYDTYEPFSPMFEDFSIELPSACDF